MGTASDKWGIFKSSKIYKETVDNINKVIFKIFGHNKQKRLGEFNTRRTHLRQEKQRQVACNQLDKDEGTNTRKQTRFYKGEGIAENSKSQEAVEKYVLPFVLKMSLSYHSQRGKFIF